MQDYIKETIESGISPFSQTYQEIRNISNKRNFAFRSSININSVDLGVLTPREYLSAVNAKLTGINLALRNIAKVMNEIALRDDRMDEIDFISVNIPVSLVKKCNIVSLIEKISKKNEFKKNEKLCLEFGADVFYENNENINAMLKKLKRAGIQTMFCGFGEEYSPLLRLDGLHFDYIILDKNVTKIAKENKGTIISTIMTLAKKSSDVIIAANLKTTEDTFIMSRFGCRGYMEEQV